MAVHGLTGLADGLPGPNLVSGEVAGDGKVAFVFPGQGSQWGGMSAALLAESEIFREHLTDCADALAPYLDWSLLDVLRERPSAPSLDRVDVVQPALFAVMVALAATWRSFGIRPAAVVGHSQGEIAAAHIADALSLDDAARIVALRSKAIAGIAGSGAMASVPLPADRVRGELGSGLSVAAVNGPLSTVMAGDAAALRELVESYRAQDIAAKMIGVNYASHSASVESVRDELLASLSGIRPRTAGTVFWSTVTGGPLDGSELTPQYWYRNLRQTVRFREAIDALAVAGYRSFIETSPHPVLTTSVQLCLEVADAVNGTLVTGSLRRDEGGWQRLSSSLAQAHVHGLPVDWAPAFPRRLARHVDLPTYAFQQERFWLDGQAASRYDPADTGHPLLGTAMPRAAGGVLFAGRFSPRTQPWLADHVVAGMCVFPGTGFAELAVRAGGQVGCAGLDELIIETPLVLLADRDVEIQVSVDEPDESGRRRLTIHSRLPDADDPGWSERQWTRNATGQVAPAGRAEPRWQGEWPPPGARPIDLDGHYEQLDAAGFHYGPSFRGLVSAWRDAERAYAEVRLPNDLDPSGFAIHPALLDMALHILGLGGVLDEPGLPFSWTDVTMPGGQARSLRVQATPSGARLGCGAHCRRHRDPRLLDRRPHRQARRYSPARGAGWRGRG